MTSVCVGCAHEGACGRDGLLTCTGRVPAAWCSCDPLRRAEAERDRCREKALSAECRCRIACGICDSRCDDYDDGDYCDAVVEEVDGE